MRNQFGEAFRGLRALRIRRHELEYPEFPDEPVEVDEARSAIATASDILAAAEGILRRRLTSGTIPGRDPS